MPRNDNSFSYLAVLALFVPLLFVAFIFAVDSAGELDLMYGQGVPDSVDYSVEGNWTDSGFIFGGLGTDSDLLYAETSNSGMWSGRIQSLEADYSGTFTGIGDAREGSGSYVVKLYNSSPDSVGSVDVVELENSTRFDDYQGSSSVVFPHGSTGNNTLLVFVAGIYGGSSDLAEGVSYGGENLTRLDSLQSGGRSLDVWYLTGPENGSHNVSASFGSVAEKTFQVYTFSGVHQDAPFKDYAEEVGTGSSFDQFVDVDDASDLAVDFAVAGDVLSAGSGQDLLFSRGVRSDSDNNNRFAGSRERGENSVFMEWSTASSSQYGHLAFSLENYYESVGGEPEKIVTVPLETGRVSEEVNFSGYRFFEVEVNLSESAGISGNNRPHVDSVSLGLQLSRDEQVGVSSEFVFSATFWLYVFGFLFFMFGILKGAGVLGEGS